MVNLNDRLAPFLAEASIGQCRLFAAGCVERSAESFFLAVAGDSSRSADADIFLAALDDLWRLEEVSEVACREWQGRTSGFEELQGDEEPSGVRAFGYDAVAALYYAYTFLVTNDTSNIVYCSNHVLNSAGYLDDIARGESGFYEEEVDAQTEAIDKLVEGYGDISLIRERARKLGRRRMEALRVIFR